MQPSVLLLYWLVLLILWLRFFSIFKFSSNVLFNSSSFRCKYCVIKRGFVLIISLSRIYHELIKTLIFLVEKRTSFFVGLFVRSQGDNLCIVLFSVCRDWRQQKDLLSFLIIQGTFPVLPFFNEVHKHPSLKFKNKFQIIIRKENNPRIDLQCKRSKETSKFTGYSILVFIHYKY